MRAFAAMAVFSTLLLAMAALAQPQADPFAGVPPLAWAERARDVLKAQRDEYIEKYTSAEIALGILATENRKLKARVEELESAKSALPPAADAMPEKKE